MTTHEAKLKGAIEVGADAELPKLKLMKPNSKEQLSNSAQTKNCQRTPSRAQVLPSGSVQSKRAMDA